MVVALWSETQCMEEKISQIQKEIHELNMTVANLSNSIVPIGAIMEYWVKLQKRDKSDTDPIQALA
jgi:hypothetical protein